MSRVSSTEDMTGERVSATTPEMMTRWLPMEPVGSTQVIEEVGKLAPEMLMIADASVSLDGQRLALVNKFYTVLYTLPKGKITDILTSQPTYYEYDLYKVEGCAWEGDDLILISEDRRIYRLPLPRACWFG